MLWRPKLLGIPHISKRCETQLNINSPKYDEYAHKYYNYLHSIYFHKYKEQYVKHYQQSHTYDGRSHESKPTNITNIRRNVIDNKPGSTPTNMISNCTSITRHLTCTRTFPHVLRSYKSYRLTNMRNDPTGMTNSPTTMTLIQVRLQIPYICRITIKVG